MGTWLVGIKVGDDGLWWIEAILLPMRPITPPTLVFSPLCLIEYDVEPYFPTFVIHAQVS
jgi:hypothetical protein